MEKLQLFAVSSIREPPMELSRKTDQQLFKCALILPIPPQLLIFHQGEWPSCENKNVTMDIYLDSKKIGEMDEDTKCFAWETGHLKSRPAGEQIFLEIKVIGLKTPTEQSPAPAPKTRKGPVLRRKDKAPPPQKQKKACEKDASEKMVVETVTPKTPEKSKSAKSSSMKDISSGSGKDKREEKKKKNLALPAIENKKKPIPPTTAVKKTRQTQLNFSCAKVSLATETQKKEGEQDEIQNKTILKLETAGMTVCTTKAAELHHTEQQSKDSLSMKPKNRTARKTGKRSLMETEKRSSKKTEKRSAVETEERSTIRVEKRSPTETEKMSVIKVEKRSPTETEKMPVIKTGKMSPVETEKRPVIKTEKISPVETEERSPEMTEDMLVQKIEGTGLDKDGPCEAQVLNENTPQMMADMPSPLPRKPMKKRLRSDMDKSQDGPTPKKRSTRMRALQSEGTPKSSRAKVVFGCDSPLKKSKTPVKTEKTLVLSDGQLTRCIDLTARAPRPSARWGHTMLLTQPHCAVLIGGQGDRQQLSKDSIWTLNTDTRKWQCEEVQSEGQKPENRMGHTATYDPTMRCIYIFGGSKNSRFFHDVHIYDLDEAKWTLAKVEGKAPTRAYHTANIHRHELWVFGGVYPCPDPNPDGCSNNLHIFSPVMQTWYTPLVQGEKPRARSGHSATLIRDQMVMFGGWDAPYCYNDLFILDLTTVDWSEPDVKGTPPKPRSWHASCALSSQRILIHGGYDGNEALEDSFIFDLDGLSWSRLVIPDSPKARAGHKAVCLPYTHESKEEDEVMIFGGGDNDGEFFSNLLSLAISFQPVVELEQE